MVNIWYVHGIILDYIRTTMYKLYILGHMLVVSWPICTAALHLGKIL